MRHSSLLICQCGIPLHSPSTYKTTKARAASIRRRFSKAFLPLASPARDQFTEMAIAPKIRSSLISAKLLVVISPPISTSHARHGHDTSEPAIQGYDNILRVLGGASITCLLSLRHPHPPGGPEVRRLNHRVAAPLCRRACINYLPIDKYVRTKYAPRELRFLRGISLVSNLLPFITCEP